MAVLYPHNLSWFKRSRESSYVTLICSSDSDKLSNSRKLPLVFAFQRTAHFLFLLLRIQFYAAIRWKSAENFESVFILSSPLISEQK